MPSLVNIFKISTEKPLVDKLISTINKLVFDKDRTVQEQRTFLEYCNSSINQILQVIIFICYSTIVTCWMLYNIILIN